MRVPLLVLVLAFSEAVQAEAQAPAAAPAPAAARPSGSGDAPGVVPPLSTRYRFLESYTRGQGQGRLDAIDQYRVAARDVLKVVTERPAISPDRQEWTRQVIYAERPAKVNSSGAVEATVRRYEAYRIAPNPSAKPSRPNPLDGLTLYYGARPGRRPLVLSLAEGRRLREDEYTEITRQYYVPALGSVLPNLPIRTGDRWTLSRAGAEVLVGQQPAGRGEPLSGTLVEVRQSAKGPNLEAVLSVSGRARLRVGDTAINARLVFAFPAPKREGSDPARAVVDARGAIVDLRMATKRTAPTEANPRLNQIVTRETVLVRELAEAREPLPVPDKAPEPTEQNSWLTYDDPQGHFHFRYPQDFQLGRPPDDFSVELARARQGPPDTVELRRVVKLGDPAADRANREPDLHVKANAEAWRQSGFEVISGQKGPLPDADWAASKRRVYRAESVLKGVDPVTKRQFRLNNELFFVQFGRDESLVVIANTAQDPSEPFRKEVEAIIRSYDFGPAPAR